MTPVQRFQALLVSAVWALLGCGTPAADAPTAQPAPCDTDQSCNDNPAVSALWGRCVQSVCQCRSGFVVTPEGRCKPQD